MIDSIEALETMVRYLMHTGCDPSDKRCTSCVECQRKKLTDSWFRFTDHSLRF